MLFALALVVLVFAKFGSFARTDEEYDIGVGIADVTGPAADINMVGTRYELNFTGSSANSCASSFRYRWVMPRAVKTRPESTSDCTVALLLSPIRTGQEFVTLPLMLQWFPKL